MECGLPTCRLCSMNHWRSECRRYCVLHTFAKHKFCFVLLLSQGAHKPPFESHLMTPHLLLPPSVGACANPPPQADGSLPGPLLPPVPAAALRHAAVGGDRPVGRGARGTGESVRPCGSRRGGRDVRQPRLFLQPPDSGVLLAGGGGQADYCRGVAPEAII